MRDTLRVGLRQPARWEPVGIDEMRRVVAEELARALAGGAGGGQRGAAAHGGHRGANTGRSWTGCWAGWRPVNEVPV